MTKEFGIRPGFISGVAGKLFVLEFVPESPIAGTVLVIPPFAEEMNRSRRMLNLQARQLASAGYRVLMPDLYGTGDSAGDFSDARWDIWRNDIAIVGEAANVDTSKPVSVLALRLGALLALDAISCKSITVDKLVLWCPCVSGKQFITRFLRMRLMASMIRGGSPEDTVASLREQLQQGEEVEVAGYTLAPDLVSHIDTLDLSGLAAKQLPESICWFEVSGSDDGSFPALAGRIADDLISSGVPVNKTVISGPQFWATPEIAIVPDLLSATTMLFAGADQW